MSDEIKTWTDGDEELIKVAQTGEGAIPIKTKEQFEALANAAKETKDYFDTCVEKMTEQEANTIRYLRVTIGCTWRAVARNAYNDGLCGANWEPSSNQLMGMALCERAAIFFDEHYMEEPWN